MTQSERSIRNRTVTRGVIPAAGLGTRLLPMTKSLPKEMLPLVDKPLIQYAVEDAAAAGCDLVVIVVPRGRSPIEDYFRPSPELERILENRGEISLLETVRAVSAIVDIRFVRQDAPLGLGYAVMKARRVVGLNNFMLLLPDDLFEKRELVLKRMIAVQERYGASVAASMRVSKDDLHRYGILNVRPISHRVHQVLDCVEKPDRSAAPSDLAIMGRYILSPPVFTALAETTPGKGGEIQLTDALSALARTVPVYAYEFEGERYDVGTKPGWLRANALLGLRDSRMRQGLETAFEEARRRRGGVVR